MERIIYGTLVYICIPHLMKHFYLSTMSRAPQRVLFVKMEGVPIAFYFFTFISTYSHSFLPLREKYYLFLLLIYSYSFPFLSIFSHTLILICRPLSQSFPFVFIPFLSFPFTIKKKQADCDGFFWRTTTTPSVNVTALLTASHCVNLENGKLTDGSHIGTD